MLDADCTPRFPVVRVSSLVATPYVQTKKPFARNQYARVLSRGARGSGRGGECQADTDILGGRGSEAYNLTPDVMHIEDTHLGNVQRADHTDHVSRADPFALAFGSSYKRRLTSCVVRCTLLPWLAALDSYCHINSAW